MVSQGDSELDPLSELSPNIAQARNNQPATIGNASPKYCMQVKHQTLHDLWSEWYGLGPFLDSKGGIEGGNRRYGSKWRSHLPKAHYSHTS
jgi:hypothetical protein